MSQIAQNLTVVSFIQIRRYLNQKVVKSIKYTNKFFILVTTASSKIMTQLLNH
ncbi:protein of unknown function [Candidatus Nitrosotalea okcheonensis]|uniref:Uncharacterized protein n=1 Tax=Candidatus Nitrosotalea okcheonensis TaxID=1903276 RepID=A0A2H1FC58_9ARCH|nr:protein of unknown function [Candidatus Nitrosotalea okcheonensis]